ncbi:MAG: ABC transporter ATP-binding protein/permease [Deltaproteobacteria bacterium]|nr:ABC transporter ATP-binding protein/permease [Deltaproteobacteria bacterium]
MAWFSKTKSSARDQARARRLDKVRANVEKYQNQQQKKYWRRFLAYLSRYRATLAKILILVLFTALFETLLPQLVRLVLDYIVPRKDFRLLGWVLGGGILAYLLHAGLRYLEQRSVVNFSLELITRIRRDLFAYQLRLPLQYFEKYGSGKLISKLTYGTTMIKLLVETFAYTCLREIVLIAMVVIAAAFINWKLTFIFLLLAPLLWCYVHRLNRFMAQVASQLQTKNDEILRILDRVYHSIRFFQLFGDSKAEAERLERVLREDKEFRVKRTMVYAGNAILINLITALIILVALYYGGRQIIHGKMKAGDVMAYIIYLGMLFHPVSELIRASAFLQAGRIGIFSVFSVYENYQPVPEPEHPVAPREMRGEVEFRNVWFSYPRNSLHLKNLNFHVRPGQKVLIVGPSGGGKVVLQDSLHLQDSILENVGLGLEDAWEEKVEGTLELAQQIGIDRKIARREKKFGEEIGAEGLGFSRGELQKLALMRAAQHDAPIVLLDEPTASMDVVSERHTLRRINEWFAEKTVFMISHRPVPDFKADWVLVMKNGRIEEQGNHFYLLTHSEYYRQLSRQTPHDAATPTKTSSA